MPPVFIGWQWNSQALQLDRPFGLFPVLERRDAVLLFEYILKIGLAGEAEIAADLSQAFFAVGEQAFGFLQLAPHDVSPHLDAQLTFEMFHHIRGAPACVGCRVLHGDRFVCMIPDIGHACVDVRRNAIRYTGITCRWQKSRSITY